MVFSLAGRISRQQLIVIEHLESESRMLREWLKGRSPRISDRERAPRRAKALASRARFCSSSARSSRPISFCAGGRSWLLQRRSDRLTFQTLRHQIGGRCQIVAATRRSASAAPSEMTAPWPTMMRRRSGMAANLSKWARRAGLSLTRSLLRFAPPVGELCQEQVRATTPHRSRRV